VGRAYFVTYILGKPSTKPNAFKTKPLTKCPHIYFFSVLDRKFTNINASKKWKYKK